MPIQDAISSLSPEAKRELVDILDTVFASREVADFIFYLRATLVNP